MLHTAVGRAVAGIILGGAVAGVVIVVRIVDSILEACRMPQR